MFQPARLGYHGKNVTSLVLGPSTDNHYKIEWFWRDIQQTHLKCTYLGFLGRIPVSRRRGGQKLITLEYYHTLKLYTSMRIEWNPWTITVRSICYQSTKIIYINSYYTPVNLIPGEASEAREITYLNGSKKLYRAQSFMLAATTRSTREHSWSIGVQTKLQRRNQWE